MLNRGRLRVSFGKRIRQLRDARGIPQEELAHAAGIHVTYLSGIENGKRNPGLLIIGETGARTQGADRRAVPRPIARAITASA